MHVSFKPRRVCIHSCRKQENTDPAAAAAAACSSLPSYDPWIPAPHLVSMATREGVMRPLMSVRGSRSSRDTGAPSSSAAQRSAGRRLRTIAQVCCVRHRHKAKGWLSSIAPLRHDSPPCVHMAMYLNYGHVFMLEPLQQLTLLCRRRAALGASSARRLPAAGLAHFARGHHLRGVTMVQPLRRGEQPQWVASAGSKHHAPATTTSQTKPATPAASNNPLPPTPAYHNHMHTHRHQQHLQTHCPRPDPTSVLGFCRKCSSRAVSWAGLRPSRKSTRPGPS